jgi:hypothetical protein
LVIYQVILCAFHYRHAEVQSKLHSSDSSMKRVLHCDVNIEKEIEEIQTRLDKRLKVYDSQSMTDRM